MAEKRIAITCGDPAGVGPEVIASWVKGHPEWHSQICLVGPHHWLRQNRGTHQVDILPQGDPEFIIQPGNPSREGAKIARDALFAAASGTQSGKFKAVVTGPTSKLWMQRVGFHFPGQTEFFADRWGGEPTMAFAGSQLRVALVTWHCPLREVPHLLSLQRLERAVSNLYQFLTIEGIENPRIAVCGLNPHAGEGGKLGTEEYDMLDPWLNDLRPSYPGLSTCLPGDTVFWRQLQGDFDGIVAMYHDQALGPLKTVDFDSAVNITLGLPYVRTSPDHGTGFAIAGKGIASDRSLGNAIELADMLSNE
ncbi:MAG: 4-hydroxythreonine-4-phosphate dehydrogenase PdxA [Verrucomicrobiota bacterium]